MARNYFKVAVWADIESRVGKRLTDTPFPRPKVAAPLTRERMDPKSLDGRRVQNWIFVFDDRNGAEMDQAQAAAEEKLRSLRDLGASPLLSVFRYVSGGPPVIGQSTVN